MRYGYSRMSKATQRRNTSSLEHNQADEKINEAVKLLEAFVAIQSELLSENRTSLASPYHGTSHHLQSTTSYNI